MNTKKHANIENLLKKGTASMFNGNIKKYESVENLLKEEGWIYEVNCILEEKDEEDICNTRCKNTDKEICYLCSGRYATIA